MKRLTTRRRDDGRWALRNDDGANPKEQINKIPRAIDRLAAYEDTGLEPEEVVAMKIVLLGRELAKITDVDGVSINRICELAQAEKDGMLVVLPPNDPLTMEELREMDGEPVWVVPLNDFEILPANYLVNAYAEQIVVDKFGAYLDFEDYGKTWLSYRRKPEEVTHGNSN